MDLQQFGTEIGSALSSSSVTECALACQAVSQCSHWRWLTPAFSAEGWESPRDCHLMSDQTGLPFSSPNTISGTRDCLPGVTTTTTSSSGSCESYNLQTQAALLGSPKHAASDTLCAITCLHVSGCNYWRWHNDHFEGRLLLGRVPGPFVNSTHRNS